MIRLALLALLGGCLDQPPQPCGDPPKKPALHWFAIDDATLGLPAADYRDLDAYHEHVAVYLSCIEDNK